MNYHIQRNGQQYGPYTLADLQRYFQTGEIVAGDLAKSEAMAEWVPVEQVIGNIPAPPVAPPLQNYGSVPDYTGPGHAPFGASGPTPMPGPVAMGWPLPPDLHWAIVLILGIVTCGIFTWVWMFVEGTYVRKIKRDNNSMMLYAIGVAILIASSVIGANGTGNAKVTQGLLNVGAIVVILVGHFQMRTSLEQHFNSEEPIKLQLSGVMTFFFNVIYFQYHFSRIRRWRTTGVLA